MFSCRQGLHLLQPGHLGCWKFGTTSASFVGPAECVWFRFNLSTLRLDQSLSIWYYDQLSGLFRSEGFPGKFGTFSAKTDTVLGKLGQLGTLFLFPDNSGQMCIFHLHLPVTPAFSCVHLCVCASLGDFSHFPARPAQIMLIVIYSRSSYMVMGRPFRTFSKCNL